MSSTGTAAYAAASAAGDVPNLGDEEDTDEEDDPLQRPEGVDGPLIGTAALQQAQSSHIFESAASRFRRQCHAPKFHQGDRNERDVANNMYESRKADYLKLNRNARQFYELVSIWTGDSCADEVDRPGLLLSVD